MNCFSTAYHLAKQGRERIVSFKGKLEEHFRILHNWYFVLPSNVRRIARKKKINVIFLAMNVDMWRYDGVYKLFAQDARFSPLIITAVRNCPDPSMRVSEQETLYAHFSSRGYNVVRGYLSERAAWVDLASFEPDIVFHTQPYDCTFAAAFSFRACRWALHCYAPYSFQMTSAAWNWDNDFQNYCWRQYLVGRYQVGLSRKVARNSGRNAVAAGYCLDEELAAIRGNAALADGAWHHDGRKRVIWGPHHSIEEDAWFKVSSFLEICDVMLKIRDDYADRIVIAFKPHPMLKGKLYLIWGRERTDAYYAKWADSRDSFDASGDYHELFVGSDAMIHCSGSFMVEYLYVDKPVLYVYSKTRNPPDIGEIGEAALRAHYPARGEADIRSFLDEVVLGGNDTLARERECVAGRYLRSPNGKMFSENVYQDILKGLKLHE